MAPRSGPPAPLGECPSLPPDLTFLVALVMAGAVAAMNGYKTDQGKGIGDAVIGKIKDAVDKVQF
jgi:hypothetical protein